MYRVLHFANNQFSDKFNNDWKTVKMTIYLDFFSYFTTVILLCLCDNFKTFPCILLKFVLHVATNQFSDKFNNEGGLL